MIGLSYYPKWHGRIADPRFTTNYLAGKFKKDIVVVEYSLLKDEVNAVAFGVKDRREKGSFIWEPLSTWEKVFDKTGKPNELINWYDAIGRKYIKK